MNSYGIKKAARKLCVSTTFLQPQKLMKVWGKWISAIKHCPMTHPYMVYIRPGFDVCPPLQRHSFRNGANVLQIAVFRG